MTGARQSRLNRSRSKQQRGRHRCYKLPRLSATMTCQEAFRAIARGCLDDLAANQQATCEGDPEALHQMRIALTRLRTARSFFSSFIPSSEWSNVKGELKWLNKHLSRARDLDVTIARLLSADDKSPEQSLGRAWRKTWSTSHRKLSLTLRSKRYRMLLRDMSIWIENGKKSSATPQSSTSLATYSARRLDRWYKKLIKKSRAFENMNSSQHHRLRIKAKRLRYILETIESLLPGQSLGKIQELLKSLRKIQKHLGHLNDAEQGHAIAATFVKPTHDNGKRWRSLFPAGQKSNKRTIKAAALILRQMAELKPI